MKTHLSSSRGVVQVWLLYVLGTALVGAGAVAAKKGFGIFSSEDPAKAKIEAAALVESNAKLQAAQAEAAALRAKADAAAAELAAQRQQRFNTGAEAVQGVILSLDQEQSPSLNVTAALSFAHSAAAAFDPVAEARVAVLKTEVAKLTSANAAIRAAALKERAELDAAIAEGKQRETAKAAEVAALTAEKSTAELAARGLGDRLTNEISAHANTEASLQTVGQKLASFARWTFWTAVLLGVVLWVLPIVAKAHPELGWLTWVAKKAGAVVAYGLHALHEGEKRVIQAKLVGAER